MSAAIQIIYCCDCRDVPRSVVESCAALVTDPPYRPHVHASATSVSAYTGGQGSRKRDLGFGALSPALRSYIAQCAARVQRWGAIYSDVESLAWWRIACESAGAEYIRTIPWVRWSMPQTTGDRPPTGWEPVSIFYGTRSGRKHWNGGGNLTHYAHKALRGDDKHPTEKPLDQALDLVQQFSDPGETVLDLFAGSGTTGLACRILGRGFIGTELDPTHAQTAAIRLVQSLSARDAERLARWRRAQDAELAELLAAKHKRSKQEERRIATIQGDWAIGSEHRQAA